MKKVRCHLCKKEYKAVKKTYDVHGQKVTQWEPIKHSCAVFNEVVKMNQKLYKELL